MPFNRRIYRLSPSQLSAETIAVTFAKTSRSPKAFDEIAAELDVEKSSQFSEKWIVGYGHSSVAEHAILHLALENVSRLAIEMIEGNRLASYTEKSTRYQEWNREAYVIPPEIQGSRFETLYIDTLGQLFDAYEHAIPLVKQVIASKDPQRSDEKEKAWYERIRTASIDVCRFLLPAASVANVGVTINARALEYAIRKLLSSDLAEVRMIGEEVKVVATQEVPTLVKYATPLSYMSQVKQAIEPFLEPVVDKPTTEMCRLVEYDPMGEQKVLAGLLYRFGQGTFAECQQKIFELSFEEQQSLVGKIFSEATPFDTPPRELEYTSYVFDMIMDQGAFFEFKRHRMMSQTPQALTTRLGFAVPSSITEAGCASQYIAAMQQAASTFEIIAAEMPAVASYVVPNGYNRRVLFELNLRELFHFIRIRCNPNAHFSIRRVGRAMIEKIQPVHPMFCAQLCVDCNESSETISQKYFSSLAKT
jgi:thymidylate synthase ThyX